MIAVYDVDVKMQNRTKPLFQLKASGDDSAL